MLALRAKVERGWALIPATVYLEFLFFRYVNTMPEISRFLGIVIYMHFNEHYPPHFHAEYNEFKASIGIETLGLIEGKLPSRVMSLVIEWAQEHQDELRENWDNIRKMGKFSKIQPLV